MQRTMKPALLILILLFFAPQSAMVCCQETTEEVASFNLQAYTPARVLISYAYTSGFDVVNVSSMGKSLYKIMSGPTSIEFTAQDIDQYTFTVVIRYEAVVAQSLQIAVFSSTYAPQGMQLNVKGNIVQIKFALTVTKEPQYPSAQEVAEQVVRQVGDQLNDFRSQTTDILNAQTQNIETQWIIVVFNMLVSVAFIIIIVFWIYPTLKTLKREGEFR